MAKPIGFETPVTTYPLLPERAAPVDENSDTELLL